MSYPIAGKDEVERSPLFVPEGGPSPETGKPIPAGRVYISDAHSDRPGQYFEGVATHVWEFEVGSYSVCDKWLKDRRGRRLSFEDVGHFGKMVCSIERTLTLVREIAAVTPTWPLPA